jgi:hypothetical protein
MPSRAAFRDVVGRRFRTTHGDIAIGGGTGGFAPASMAGTCSFADHASLTSAAALIVTVPATAKGHEPTPRLDALRVVVSSLLDRSGFFRQKDISVGAKRRDAECFTGAIREREVVRSQASYITSCAFAVASSPRRPAIAATPHGLI